MLRAHRDIRLLLGVGYLECDGFLADSIAYKWTARQFVAGYLLQVFPSQWWGNIPINLLIVRSQVLVIEFVNRYQFIGGGFYAINLYAEHRHDANHQHGVAHNLHRAVC